MTQQRPDYPLDYSKGSNEAAEDRSRATTTETAADRLMHAADHAQDVMGRMAEQARDYGEKAQEAAKNFKPFVEKSVKEQPMTTLAAAAVVGFVLGALWKK